MGELEEVIVIPAHGCRQDIIDSMQESLRKRGYISMMRGVIGGKKGSRVPDEYAKVTELILDDWQTKGIRAMVKWEAKNERSE